ncbi:hypothetical protein [Cryptosporangium arvum]|uniref:Uncharacterized protein n=1 Tax=Cryptosporangium arvum DSM 44712 TaxID=927661 RepID=A0A010ZW40_9ACTN|nr:hypothetical protein [Cryptosporangium arvum]EXG82884.1 hypothetical protein CryarDRAFT_4086 [Cryptosporangium arvum DSM 44712]
MTPDWSNFEDAFGVAFAATDILPGVLSADATTRADALGYLYGALHHQDTVYGATAPAVDYVLTILGDPRADPMRVALLRWLTSVLDAARWKAGHPADVDACLARRPRVRDAMDAFRTDADLTVAHAALEVVAACEDVAPPPAARATPGGGSWSPTPPF